MILECVGLSLAWQDSPDSYKKILPMLDVPHFTQSILFVPLPSSFSLTNQLVALVAVSTAIFSMFPPLFDSDTLGFAACFILAYLTSVYFESPTSPQQTQSFHF